jgi:hypothetical protein
MVNSDDIMECGLVGEEFRENVSWRFRMNSTETKAKA